MSYPLSRISQDAGLPWPRLRQLEFDFGPPEESSSVRYRLQNTKIRPFMPTVQIAAMGKALENQAHEQSKMMSMTLSESAEIVRMPYDGLT